MSMTAAKVSGAITAEARAMAWYGPNILESELRKKLDELLYEISRLPADGELRFTLSAEVTR